MTKILTCFSFFLAMLSATPIIHAQSIIYQADFRVNEPEWLDYNDSYIGEKIVNGKFYLTHKKNKFSYKAVEVVMEDKQDYRVETIVTHISGEEGSNAGLAFAGDGESNNYFFTISPSGSYFFACRDGGYFKPIIRETKSPAIKKGNVPNKLGVETSGDQIKLFINGQEVAKVNMGEPFGNEIGVIVQREGTAAFDYLKVSNVAGSADNTEAVQQMANQTSPQKADHPAINAATPAPTPNSSVIAAVAPPLTSPVNHATEDAIKKADVAVTPIAKDSTSKVNGQFPAMAVKQTTATTDTAKLQTKVVDVPVSQKTNDTSKILATPIVKNTSGPALTDSVTHVTNLQSADAPKKTTNGVVSATNPKTTDPAITKMVYHTDFTKDDQNGWSTKQRDSVSLSLDSGVYKINRIANNGYTCVLSSANVSADMQRNFVLETEISHYSGGQNYGYGLAFGADSLRQYNFCITDSGYYYINKFSNKATHTIVGITASDAIHIGNNVKNKLAVKNVDGQLYFYINDQKVDSHIDFPFYGGRFGFSVSAAQVIAIHNVTLGYTDKDATQNSVDSVKWPRVVIISPEVTRGFRIVQNSDRLHVMGKATDPAGIFSVQVNELQADVDARGNFTADIPLPIGDNPLQVSVLDSNMKRGVFNFHVVRNIISVDEKEAVNKQAKDGKYYALVIGVQNYDDPNIMSLEGPVGDAKRLADELIKNYTFERKDVNVLPNPTRAELLEALDDLTTKIDSNDNLIIFYAGHGIFDSNRQQGYWLPSDAVKRRRDTWVSNSELIDDIAAIKSKHTLLIADACFSASIFKSRGIDLAPRDIQAVYKLPSRKAITSGAMTEVPDNSVFIDYLIKKLDENKDNFLPAEMLFTNFKAAVIYNSPTGQVPQFGEIKGAGDEGGDFVFIKRN